MASSPLFILLIFCLPSSSLSRRPCNHPKLPFSSDNYIITSVVVQQICNATRFPSTCESTLSSLPPKSTHSDVILASISSSTSSLQTALSNAKAILAASSSNPNRTNAAKNCIELLGYSSRRLSDASLAVNAARIHHALAWTSAALLYHSDCFGALRYVNGTKQVDDAMRFLISLGDLTSNALSLIFAYNRFGDDTSRWIPPQTERDGYWTTTTTTSSSSSKVVGSESNGGGFSSEPRENPDAKVCKGGGPTCFSTVQEAVNSAPDYSDKRYVVYITEGVYDEIVRVPFGKTNLVFVGDGMGKTVITGNLSVLIGAVSTYNTATVAVNGDGFMAKDLTIQNTAGPDAHQAVALRSDSDLSVFENVEFLGHQDTLYAHSLRQLYKSCRIAGTVDFVFGNSASVFQDCSLSVLPRQLSPEMGETSTVSAQGRTDPAQSTGFVFRNCSVDGSSEYLALYRKDPTKHRTYLGRPWKEYSRTVYIHCYIGEIVRPEGWLIWDENFALSTLYYGEYESSGPGSNVTGRVGWSNQIPPEHVDTYSVENFIRAGGDGSAWSWITSPKARHWRRGHRHRRPHHRSFHRKQSTSVFGH